MFASGSVVAATYRRSWRLCADGGRRKETASRLTVAQVAKNPLAIDGDQPIIVLSETYLVIN